MVEQEENRMKERWLEVVDRGQISQGLGGGEQSGVGLDPRGSSRFLGFESK